MPRRAGGIVHITGARSDDQKRSATGWGLGHEITHITAKHTSTPFRRTTGVVTPRRRAPKRLPGAMISKLRRLRTEHPEPKFDRGDENESDRVGVQLAAKLGYAPSGLAEVLTSIAARNKDQAEPNGMVALIILSKNASSVSERRSRNRI